jgi:large subunit ribosomal protein L2
MLQKLKPTTPSQRNLIKINNKHLSKKPLLKFKIKGLKNSAGKNNTGKITSFHRGGGHKQNYRKIDFYRKENSIGIVCSIEYDPNRTAHIASIYNFFKKNYFYIIAPKNLVIGNIIKSGPNAEINLGHSLPMSKIPEGSLIYNVSTKISERATISRSAGTFSHLMEKTSTYCRIKLPSGEQRKISIKCYASLGVVSNELRSLTSINKAGRSRWLNKRPTVRGVAMNPIDHPHGGGEGRKSGRNVTPWGKPNNRGKTRNTRNKLRLK